MRHLESPSCHIEEVAEIPFISIMYISNTSIFTWELHLSLKILIRIKVTSVEWTWLRLEWSHALYMGDVISPIP